MKKVKGYVVCGSTNRMLNRFKIVWIDEKLEEVEQNFGSETEGFFEISLPPHTQQITIVKENYKQACIYLTPNHTSYIAKIQKTK